MPSGVDESALLDDGWCPALSTGVSPPSPPSPLLNGKAMRPPRQHVVRRLIRSPFAAVLRMTTSRARAGVSASDEQPSDDGDDTAGRGVERRRREALRRPSLEQLLRMNSSRADRKSEPDTTMAMAPSSHEVSAPSRSHFTVGASGDERRSKAVPVVKFDACGRRTIANAKRLVVAFESLRSCSRAPGVSVVVPVPKSKGPDGKVAAAGRASGKPELFYSRPIPMGRRCRVQHLEESPYK